MSSISNEEVRHRLNWMKDEQSRTNAAFETQIKELQSENHDLRNRVMVLTRLLIARQILTAEEIATAVTALAPPVEEPPASEASA